MGALIDPIVVDIDAASKPFVNLHKDVIPLGFDNWKEFGAPDGAPFKSMRTSLSFQQHNLIGWILAIHFLSAAELVAAHLAKLAIIDNESQDSAWGRHRLPPPQTQGLVLEGVSKASSMLYGIPFTDLNDQGQTNNGRNDHPQLHDNTKNSQEATSLNNTQPQWYMNPIHCRTTFEPTIGAGETDGGRLVDSIITGNNAEVVDLMIAKGPRMYNSGWVMDLGPEAKRIERSLEQYNLGYGYSTVAYGGVPASGTLKLFLTYEENESVPTYELDKVENGEDEEKVSRDGDRRRIELKEKSPHTDPRRFQNVVVCGTNENYGDKQCDMERDLEFIVGGEKATEVHHIDAMGVSDRGKQLCVTMVVPTNATYTTKERMTEEAKEEKDSKSLENQTRMKKKAGDRQLEMQPTIGLSLLISVKGKVSWKTGPCFVSHVVWEQIRSDL